MQPKLVEEMTLADDDKLRDAVAQHHTDIAVLQQRMDTQDEVLGHLQRDTKATAEGVHEILQKLEHRLGFRAGAIVAYTFIVAMAGAFLAWFAK